MTTTQVATSTSGCLREKTPKASCVNEILKRLYKQHAPALLLYARIWCRFSEDALQEAMIELSRQSELPPDPVAWLYQAVRFKAINLHRGERRRNKREREVALDRQHFFMDAMQSDTDAAELEVALKGLPEDLREIVIAKVWGGLTFEQIGYLNGGSSSGIHRRYHEALEKLKEQISGIAYRGFK